ncbi:MAG: hypothetical protein OK474_03815 [Thaumarchaeota archaeon]|nr:hypothetical protein [Nitrososphaerota archaeon]
MTPQQNKPEKRISGRIFLIILIVGAIGGVALTAGSIYLNASPTGTALMTGTLFISSAGQLKSGGSESVYVATYNVSLAAISGTGTMNLTLSSNTTDLLRQHEFPVTDFVVTPNNLTMTFLGASVNLGWINNSTVWHSLNATYTGASGPNAPATELRGSISPTDFPGVPPGYYVVLSVSIPSQPQDNIPFFVGPVAAWETPTRIVVPPKG